MKINKPIALFQSTDEQGILEPRYVDGYQLLLTRDEIIELIETLYTYIYEYSDTEIKLKNQYRIDHYFDKR